VKRLWQVVDSFEPRGTPLALARSILAFAQLTVLLLASDRLLFAIPPGTAPESRCAGLTSVSLWCVTGSGGYTGTLGRALAIAVLLTVVIGYRPRWTCVPHYYVAFSIAVDVTAKNGGDNAAEIFALLLIPLCLDDRRSWAWREPTLPLRPAWRGAAFAAHVVLRCQIAVIYLIAAISKLTFPAWRQGTALGILAHDPEYGLPGAVRPFAQHLLSHVWAADLLTWSVPAVEILIGLSMLLRRRTRIYGLTPAILLHGAIVLLMGLFSFGLIMIALVLAAACADMPTAPPTCDHDRQTTRRRVPEKEYCHDPHDGTVRTGTRVS